MFQIGDYIIYENRGVCKVKDIGTVKVSGAAVNRMFYTLTSHYTEGNVVYTPVDNDKVIMRPLLSREEAESLIDEINSIEVLWIPDEKGREEDYKKALRKCDCKELVKIIKTIYLRKQERLNDGKKMTSIDEKYFRLAEDCLYGELAVSLGISREEVKDYVVSRVSD